MENERYYFPFNSQSLAHYMGSGCIKPGNYFSNKPKDLQDHYYNFLLLTTHFGTVHTDCCMEIILTQEEIKELIDIHNGLFLYGRPLPVSRIKGIYFNSQAQVEQTVANIRMSTAFIPKWLIHVTKGFDQIAVKLPPALLPTTESYIDQAKRFDQYLGGFSLLRLAGETYMNYSENYFSILAFFNEIIGQELEAANRIIDKRFWGIFTGSYGFHKIYPILNKEVTEEDVKALAQEENQSIRKDPVTHVIDLNRLDKNTYIAAVLNMYGTGMESRKKRIDELILSHFKDGIKAEKTEGIALCYGLNRGYTALQNQYSINNRYEAVKFQLDSQLDYYTIESLYQYAFYSRCSKAFTYIDEWCPKACQASPNHENEYRILDVTVIGKRKIRVLSKEYWEKLLPTFMQGQLLMEKKLPELFQELGKIIYKDTRAEVVEEFKYHITPMFAETQATYLSKNEVRKIVANTLKYNAKDLETLLNEARAKGLSIPSDITREELIVLLLIAPNQL